MTYTTTPATKVAIAAFITFIRNIEYSIPLYLLFLRAFLMCLLYQYFFAFSLKMYDK